MDWAKLASDILGTPTALIVAVICGWRLKAKWDKFVTKDELTACQKHEEGTFQRLSETIESNTAWASNEVKELRGEMLPRMQRLDDGQTTNLIAVSRVNERLGRVMEHLNVREA